MRYANRIQVCRTCPGLTLRRMAPQGALFAIGPHRTMLAATVLETCCGGCMGAPVGNKNSSKENRLWAETIRRIAVQTEGARLRRIAEKLYDKAEEGDIQAIKEIGDRLDGKAVQSTELSGPDGGDIPTHTVVEFVGTGQG